MPVLLTRFFCKTSCLGPRGGAQHLGRTRCCGATAPAKTRTNLNGAAADSLSGSSSSLRLPSSYPTIVPVCYGKNDGKARFVRPWNVYEPIDADLPSAGSVGSDLACLRVAGRTRACTTGGSLRLRIPTSTTPSSRITSSAHQDRKVQLGRADPPALKALIGPTGQTGQTGSKGDGFVFRGEWDASTKYQENDVVTDRGSAYIALGDSLGVDPSTPSESWSLFVARGEQGAHGVDGTNGIGATVALIPPVPPGTGPCGLEGGALVTDGNGNVVPVCSGKSGTTGQGAGMVGVGEFCVSRHSRGSKHSGADCQCPGHVAQRRW